MIALLLSLLAALLLTSCGSMMMQTHKGEQFYPIKENASIQIKRPLRVEAEHARAYLQAGKLIHKDELDLYQVDCEIEITTVMEIAQIVPAGSFTITDVEIKTSQIVFWQKAPLLLAMGGGGRGSTIDVKRFYKFHLSSRQHPQVMYMHCRGVQEMENIAELPTLEEMKSAVGDYISFDLL